MKNNQSAIEKIWANAAKDNSEKLESASGVGSTIKYTENLRNILPEMLRKFSIKSIFDAPCGDMNWMNIFLKENDIDYIGGELVQDLVTNNQKYSNKKTKIIKFNITTDKFPTADLWLCRDCWFHLTDEHIFSSIENFLKSDIKFILTTTHINTGFKNSNLKETGFKLIDLFSEPYSFPTPLHRITDYYGKKSPREMVLFSREQILEWAKRK
jgi:hypothetical protein